ncbi:MAG: hypothetical protein U9N86_08165 [Bacteroidota bacterium]|nr:hypothetical protein [Bacteroidota bacterium]
MKYKDLIDNMTRELQNPMTALKTLEYNMFGGDRPQIHWSWTNQFIATMHGYRDSRSFRSWQKVGRQIIKGQKAFYITKPYTFKDKNKPGEPVLTGFGVQAEFGYEQTKGDPLPEYDINKAYIHPDMVKIAESIGVTVKTGLSNGEAGYFCPDKKLIMITSDDKEVLYHELAHAVDYYLHDDGTPEFSNETKMKEVVAEYSSAIIARYFDSDSKIEVSKKYIEDWSGKDLLKAMKVAFPRVKAIVEYILEGA